MYRSENDRRKQSGLKSILSTLGFLLTCLFLLSACGSSTTRSIADSAIPTPTPGPIQAVTLKTIHMINTNTGWAVTNDNHLLYTAMGVQHWQDVTPAAGGRSFTLGASYFLDGQNAWVTLQFKSTTSVFYTYTSGSFWYETPIVDTGVTVTHIQFLDAQNGWLTYCKTRDTSTNTEQVNIFSTNDGGADWYLRSGSTANATEQDGIANDGLKSGLSFLNASNGWLTTSMPTNEHFLLYTTSDGSATWHAQLLTLPSTNGGNETVSASPPQFFTTGGGILSLTVTSAKQTTLVFYQSSDGGKTWQQYATNNQISSTLTFYDSDHAWATGSGNSARTIYATSDGGKSWQRQGSLPSSVVAASQLDFVNASVGWAIGSAKDQTTGLFQTSDGGKTWTAISSDSRTV